MFNLAINSAMLRISQKFYCPVHIIIWIDEHCEQKCSRLWNINHTLHIMQSCLKKI